MPQVKETFSNLKNFFWLTVKILGLVWQANKYLATTLAATSLLGGVLPSLQIYLSKLILDEIVKIIGQNSLANLSHLWLLLGIGLVLGVFQSLATNLSTFSFEALADYLNRFVQKSSLLKNLELDFKYFEDPKFYNKLSKVEREASWRPSSAMRSVFEIIKNLISLITLFALLTTLSSWVVALLLVVSVPSLISGIRYAQRRYTISDIRTPLSRQVNYLAQLISTGAVTEVKLFRLGDYLLGKFSNFYNQFIKENLSFSKEKLGVTLLLDVISQITYYSVYLWILFKTLIKQFTLGDLTLYSSSFQRAQGTLQSLLQNSSDLYEHHLFLTDYFDFMSLKPQIASPINGIKFNTIGKKGVEFKNVTFGYDKEKPPVLKNINLKIVQNEEIALVGENGAGKTTLIKLLVRIYDPWEGQILINGVDLKEYDLPSLYEKLGVLGQDFVHYQLTARENIGFGKLERMGDMKAIKKAAQMAAINDYIESLPQKYETFLGRTLESGAQPSGGQWQRIALARAFMRDPEILILDEPTSSLDAKAEAEIFQSIYDLIRDKIVIIISHRFSTVRLAKNIYVLDGGQIIEQGSHEDLIGKKGLYEEMFSLQAKGYQ